MFHHVVTFAWRNILRNKRRTFFTVMAVGVGVASIIIMKSYVNGFIKYSSEEMIKSECGHIRIVHKDFLRLERIMPKDKLVSDLPYLRRVLAGIPEVDLTMERIKFQVILSHQDANEATLVTGIDPVIGDKVLRLSETVVQGAGLTGEGQDLLLGRKLAAKLGVKVGDELLLVTSDVNYSTYALPFKVAGLFESGNPYVDKRFVYISIANARKMLDCGDAAHDLLLFIKNPDQARAIADRVRGQLSAWPSARDWVVTPWLDNGFIQEIIPYMKTAIDVILWILLFIVALVILNTMLMTVMERYHEIGILKAIGFYNLEVAGTIMAETVFIGFMGAVTGGLFGSAISLYLEKNGINLVKLFGREVFDKLEIKIPIFGNVIYPDFTVAILLGAMLFGILVAIFAVLYPVIKSWRMQPVDAFRSQLKV